MQTRRAHIQTSQAYPITQKPLPVMCRVSAKTPRALEAREGEQTSRPTPEITDGLRGHTSVPIFGQRTRMPTSTLKNVTMRPAELNPSDPSARSTNDYVNELGAPRSPTGMPNMCIDFSHVGKHLETRHKASEHREMSQNCQTHLLEVQESPE